jgi:hypothetical protein
VKSISFRSSLALLFSPSTSYPYALIAASFSASVPKVRLSLAPPGSSSAHTQIDKSIAVPTCFRPPNVYLGNGEASYSVFRQSQARIYRGRLARRGYIAERLHGSQSLI